MTDERDAAHWHIWIDTGGTFTDCLARDPENTIHRAKVLSSGGLRGRVIEIIDEATLRVRGGWPAGVAFLTGFHLRPLGDHDAPAIRITGHDPDRETITLESRPSKEVAAEGAAFEVSTDEPAPILAARMVTKTPGTEELPPTRMRLATTRGTNALLERAGGPVALLITKGFRDLLVIGDQRRPDLFALAIERPAPLPEAIVEVPERLAADGSVIVELDEDAVRDAAQDLTARGVTSAAVALMHSYREPKHEKRVATILRDAGFEHVSISSELAPLIEILPRTETAVVDGYLAGVIRSYVSDVVDAMGGDATHLHIMTSAGGLVRADQYSAKDSLLSGPAGGVAGMAAAGKQSGETNLIGFDMGGTSTDVARFDGDFEYRFSHTVGDAHLLAPALAIETVAAGGGSICEYRDGRLRVGPKSAGAAPGPACYGADGPLTVTDVNLLAGRLDPEAFEIPIDRDAAERALHEVIDRAKSDADEVLDADELLDGFLRIANERMASAIEQISLRKGYDPAEYALVSFGGAGGQHACALVEMLGMKRIIMPADASLLSAFGVGHAAIERFGQKQVMEQLDDVREELADWFEACARQAMESVRAEGVNDEAITVRRRIAHLRLLGQDATIDVEVDDLAALDDEFVRRYEALYGHAPEGKPIEVESIRVVASSSEAAEEVEPDGNLEPREIEAAGSMRARFAGRWIEARTYRRDDLAPGATLAGPALVFDARSAYVIEPGWSCTIDAAEAIVLVKREQFTAEDAESAADQEKERAKRRSAPEASSNNLRALSGPRGEPNPRGESNPGSEPELVRLELFTNRFASMAEEMGEILQRTALSTNVKRRMDFSCALLDANGELVVNAPHQPVHLGAMGICVRTVAGEIDMQPGDVVITNHPGYGGSHLPDITIITPVFDGDHSSAPLIGYVASRAHHAEIGGTRPGSMPPTAKCLAEEGVVILPQHLYERGRSRFDAIEQLLREPPHNPPQGGGGPRGSRAVEDNLADLRAAVAANHRGARALRDLVDQHGRDEVTRQMNALKARAARLARQAIESLDDGVYEATERLDDGSPICVKIDIDAGRARIDFAGSAETHQGNLNATPAIVRSAVLYVLRLMVGERLPLNEGIMESVEINLPEGMLNPDFSGEPTQAPAVVGGNVETSQRLVDTLIKALNLAACSQGTMNNLLFGNDRFGYYETICGGSGATADHDGADAVHTHMTNTRITDPEVIEHRYPVRLDRFAIREDSGGAGRYSGGRGAVREFTFLEPVALSMLTQHRVEEPFGTDEGGPGKRGRQQVIRKNGETITLDPVDQCDLEPGDRLIVKTPGGGGWGRPAGST